MPYDETNPTRRFCTARQGIALATCGVALLIGCEPPPASQGTSEPEIRLLYPDPDVPLALDPDTGNLRFLVVVDIVGLTFVSPGLATENADGEGHWHAALNDVYLDAPPALWYWIDEPGWSTGDAAKLTVTLQDNEHGDLDQYTNWAENFEFSVQ